MICCRRLLTRAMPAALIVALACAGAFGAAGGQRPAAGATAAQPGPVFSDAIIADIQQVVEKGYDAFDVVATFAPDGSIFIGIAGTLIGSADGYTNWVFFFAGTTYLGTDTLKPSPGLQLVGSPGAGKINVQYTNYAPDDPLCCPSLEPVTITYTWDGTAVTPSGTPPGH
jgi:hypothetical protein